MAVTIVLKNGVFIDVVTAAAAGGWVRSSSLPACQSNRVELFSFEEEYVSTLSAMWSQNALPVTQMVQPLDGLPRALSGVEAKHDKEMVDVASSEAHARGEVRSIPSPRPSPLERDREVRSGEQPVEQREKSRKDLAEKRPLYSSSPGSVGHPLFCCKPCAFFRAGLCEHGTECGFCHERHATSTLKVQGDNKCLLMKLGDSQRQALLAEVVRQKLDMVDVGPAGARLARDWRAATSHLEFKGSVSDPQLPGLRVPGVSKLLRNLFRTNLHTLCGVARTTCQGSAVALATQSLLDSLREGAGTA